MKSTTILRAKDASGKVYEWAFGKDGKYWFLRDHTGYIRTLEATWRDSVPRILAIAANHGFAVNVS